MVINLQKGSIMCKTIDYLISAQAAEDGAGVKLKRVFSSDAYRFTNPFVMLDEFGSDEAEDYIAGFPDHPHKGFDTLTFMLNGTMTHEDSLGNRGEISEYGVQWMRTGSGIIHSEMPAQTEGKMRGMQFWLNIPKALKSEAPQYLDYPSIIEKTPNGNIVRLIAGSYGMKSTPYTPEHTAIQIYYVEFTQASEEEFTIPQGHNTLIYLLDGIAHFDSSRVRQQELGVLSQSGDSVRLQADRGTKLILFSGLPIHEPMIQHGPFVMNSMQEIIEAFDEFRSGKFSQQ